MFGYVLIHVLIHLKLGSYLKNILSRDYLRLVMVWKKNCVHFTSYVSKRRVNSNIFRKYTLFFSIFNCNWIIRNYTWNWEVFSLIIVSHLILILFLDSHSYSFQHVSLYFITFIRTTTLYHLFFFFSNIHTYIFVNLKSY